MIAQLPNLNAILKCHEIPRKVWPELRAFLEDGVRPSDGLMTRLHHATNYKAALNDALKAIPCEHTFPPADYRSPVPYEALLADDIRSEAMSSAGALSAAR